MNGAAKTAAAEWATLSERILAVAPEKHARLTVLLGKIARAEEEIANGSPEVLALLAQLAQTLRAVQS